MLSSLPRSLVSRPFEGYPAYGAVHDVVPNQQLREFMFDFSRISDKVFNIDGQKNRGPEEDIAEEAVAGQYEPILEPTGEFVSLDTPVCAKVYDSRKFYRIFDTESLGVSVVEMDPAAKTARQFKTIWESQDFGAVENEARNQLGQMPTTAPKLWFTHVDGVGKRLPGVPKTEVRQKIALIPDTDRFLETLDLIEDEADVIINAIKRRLKQFVYPWDITPHLTFSVFRSSAQPDQIAEIKAQANALLTIKPFAVRLGALAFRSKSERSRR